MVGVLDHATDHSIISDGKFSIACRHTLIPNGVTELDIPDVTCSTPMSATTTFVPFIPQHKFICHNIITKTIYWVVKSKHTMVKMPNAPLGNDFEKVAPSSAPAIRVLESYVPNVVLHKGHSRTFARFGHP
jgi:hypothetical protein